MESNQVAGPREHASNFSFVETLKRLEDAIAAAGMTIFARIDHAAAAPAELVMPPTMVLIYGNPRGGTPIMLKVPLTALELPLRVLLREQDGQTSICFRPIAPLLSAFGLPAEIAGRLEPAQQLLVDAVL
jgi:uncharacterized protein (DUF302 family)